METTLSALFWLQAKSLSKRVRKKPVKIDCSKISPEENLQTNLPLNSEEVLNNYIVFCPKQKLSKLNLRFSQNDNTIWGAQDSEEGSMHKRINQDI